MAAFVEDSKILAPFMPSLFHLALVKVSLPLYNGFPYEILERAFTEIFQEKSTESGGGSNLIIKTSDVEFIDHRYILYGCSSQSFGATDVNREMTYIKAREILLFIPGLLRNRVLNTVRSLHIAAYRWRMDYFHTFKPEVLEILKPEICMLYWRSDGTIDTIKTIQELLLNENIDIKKRFELACICCLEEDIQNLWNKIEASDMLILGTGYIFMVQFWIRRMRCRSQISWIQDLSGYFEPPVNNRSVLIPIPRISRVLSLLQPGDRERFLPSLGLAKTDDFQFCLHTLTKEEEEQMLQRNVFNLLHLYLQWPYQSLFLETVEKIWDYIKALDFFFFLTLILSYKETRNDFGYSELLEDFWDRSPHRLRERVKQRNILSKQIQSFLDETVRKRKADDDDEGRNSKIKRFSSDADSGGSSA